MSENIKEGLSAIAREILQDVRKEAEAIIREAESEAKETLRISKETADKTYADIIAKNAASTKAEKRRIQSLTEVDARNNLLQVKEDLINIAFEKATVKLAEFAKTEQYRSYLTMFIEEAAKKIDSQNLILSVNLADRAWLKQGNLETLSKNMRVKFTLSEETIPSMGGCVIQTEDKKKVLDNTLENRLEQLKPDLRLKMAIMLFGREEMKRVS